MEKAAPKRVGTHFTFTWTKLAENQLEESWILILPHIEKAKLRLGYFNHFWAVSGAAPTQ